MLEFKNFKKNTDTDAQENDINGLNFVQLNIFVQKTGKEKAESNLQNTPGKSIDTLNFYCFSGSNTNNAEDLNFNNLKKCQKSDYVNLLKNNQKFLVVDFDNIVENQDTNIAKKIQYWHNQEMEFFIQFVSGSANMSFDSTIKSILHKGFSPTITSS